MVGGRTTPLNLLRMSLCCGLRSGRNPILVMSPAIGFLEMARRGGLTGYMVASTSERLLHGGNKRLWILDGKSTARASGEGTTDKQADFGRNQQRRDTIGQQQQVTFPQRTAKRRPATPGVFLVSSTFEPGFPEGIRAQKRA